MPYTCPVTGEYKKGLDFDQRFVLLVDSLKKVHDYPPLRAWLSMGNVCMLEVPPGSTQDTNVLDSEVRKLTIS